MKLRGLLKIISGLVIITPATVSVVACGDTTNGTPNATNLASITEITGVTFTFDSSKTYSAFNSTIANATQFANQPITKFTVQYYASNTSTTEITNNNQLGSGTVFIVIVASSDDPNWTGQTSDTNRIMITIVDNRTNLNTITDITDLTQAVNPTATYSSLDAIIKNAQAFTNKPLTNYSVKYYDQSTGGTEITTQMQTTGTVYVVITADASDMNWDGSTSDTNRLHFDLNKTDLGTITSLTGLNITVDPSQTYAALNATIATANEFSTNALGAGYTVQWYAAASGGTDISTQNQTGGSVYVVITAAANDPYWTGSTSNTTRISVTINKVNLSTITSLSGLNITVNPSQTYAALNATIATANEFSTNALGAGYTVQWYAAASGGTDISTQNQAGGPVYVVITAANNDPYWTGSTSNTTRISITINKINLSTLTSLSGLNITVNPSQTYAALNNTIATATEFSTNALATGYTIAWFDAVTAGNNITNNNQAGGTAYVVITAANNDPYWTGSTSNTTRISITINKVNLSTVASLSGLNITVNPSQAYAALNTTIATATEFSTNALAAGYTVDWYAAASGGTTINNQNQAGGPVYVVITAANNDPYWTGNTSNTTRISVTINKVNLSTITSLSGLTITGNTGQAYNQLDSQIATASEFSTNALGTGYTVDWYAAASGGTAINTQNQAAGTVYVVITAANNDPYWTGNTSNSNRIPVVIGAFFSVTGTTGEMNAIATASNGTIFAGSSNGSVYKLATGDTSFSQISGTSGSIFALTTAPDGSVYAGSSNGQVYKSDGTNNFTLFSTITGGNNVTVLTVDKDQNILAATNNGTASKVYLCLAGQSSFSDITGNATGIISSITSDSQGSIYAGSSNGSVYLANPGASFSSTIPGTNGVITSLYNDSSDNLYAANSNGVIFKAPVNQVRFNVTIVGAAGAINSLITDSSGNLYAGSSNSNVYKVNAGTTSVTQTFQGITGMINSITFSSTNKLFVAVTTGTGTGTVYESIF